MSLRYKNTDYIKVYSAVLKIELKIILSGPDGKWYTCMYLHVFLNALLGLHELRLKKVALQENS